MDHHHDIIPDARQREPGPGAHRLATGSRLSSPLNADFRPG
jgi:hypothetical protein